MSLVQITALSIPTVPTETDAGIQNAFYLYSANSDLMLREDSHLQQLYTQSTPTTVSPHYPYHNSGN